MSGLLPLVDLYHYNSVFDIVINCKGMIYLPGDNELIQHSYGTEINVDRMSMLLYCFG